MKRETKNFRNGIFLFMSMLLFSSCVNNAEKTTPKVYTVEIKQMQFQPAELTVVKGDTVVFVNHDIVTHDVTEEPNKAWTSGPLANGSSWSMEVTKSVDYFCSIHPVMKGKLLVK